MLTERIFTAVLKHKNRELLKFDRLGKIEPPDPGSVGERLLYVHIPFCEELCPYCSFNRFPFQREIANEYFDALRREIRMYADRGFKFGAVYVGGGTPTVIPERMADLLFELRELFAVREISIETNPNHVTEDIVRRFKDAGVNRFSVGVQSFDDGLLQKMDRYHKYGSGEEIKRRLSHFMGVFDTLNVDMIFNFPTQTTAMLERDLEIIRDIKADQVTFYPLMVSDMTRRELAARFGAISYAQEKRFYETIVEKLGGEYGFGTAWCFSRKKSMIDEYIVNYDEYVGVGSGAFGYVNGAVYADTFALDDYFERIARGEFPLFAKKTFSFEERVQYYFMMKLFGMSLDIGEAERDFGGRFRSALWKELRLFKMAGAIREQNGIILPTRKGRYFWVIMMREFFTGVNNFRDLCRNGPKGK